MSRYILKKDILVNKIVLINESLCIACGKCVKICPKKILFINAQTNKCKVTDELKCGKSGCCEKICSAHAIKIIRG